MNQCPCPYCVLKREKEQIELEYKQFRANLRTLLIKEYGSVGAMILMEKLDAQTEQSGETNPNPIL